METVSEEVLDIVSRAKEENNEVSPGQKPAESPSDQFPREEPIKLADQSFDPEDIDSEGGMNS